MLSNNLEKNCFSIPYCENETYDMFWRWRFLEDHEIETASFGCN